MDYVDDETIIIADTNHHRVLLYHMKTGATEEIHLQM